MLFPQMDVWSQLSCGPINEKSHESESHRVGNIVTRLNRTESAGGSVIPLDKSLSWTSLFTRTDEWSVHRLEDFVS